MKITFTLSLMMVLAGAAYAQEAPSAPVVDLKPAVTPAPTAAIEQKPASGGPSVPAPPPPPPAEPPAMPPVNMKDPANLVPKEAIEPTPDKAPEVKPAPPAPKKKAKAAPKKKAAQKPKTADKAKDKKPAPPTAKTPAAAIESSGIKLADKATWVPANIIAVNAKSCLIKVGDETYLARHGGLIHIKGQSYLVMVQDQSVSLFNDQDQMVYYGDLNGSLMPQEMP